MFFLARDGMLRSWPDADTEAMPSGQAKVRVRGATYT